MLRVAAGVIRAVTKAIRAVTGAAGWLVDLWRQADAKTDRPSRSLLNHHAQGRGDRPLPRPCLDLDQEVHMSLRFADLNPLGRAIIIVVAALTFGVAAISFATSYGALYAYARDTGLYSERLTRLWPLLLDGAFIVAQLAAILAGILRGSRGWPILTMLLTGALTVWFNLQHAGSRPRPPPGRGVAAGADDAGLRDRHPDREVGHDRPRQAPRPHRSPTHRRHGAGGGLALGRAGLERSAPQPPRRAGRRAPMVLTRQATTFRKTHRTAKLDCGAGRVLTGRGDQAPTHRGIPGPA